VVLNNDKVVIAKIDKGEKKWKRNY
jgi:hypothetical protein